MIELQSLTLSYGSRTVLSEVSLTVEAGEVVALIGPNGAGKSTLIRATSGVLRPVEGTVMIGKNDINRMKPQERARRVAVVPQAPRMPDAFSVEDTVLMGRTAYLGWMGRESQADREMATSAMERTAILDLRTRRIGELSGGEGELVLLARALAQSTPALLLDEPTTHLDLRHQSRILELVKGIAHEDNHAVLLALHDLNLAARFADRVALLWGGRLRALGSPKEVLTRENLGAAYQIQVNIFPHPVHGTPVIFPEDF